MCRYSLTNLFFCNINLSQVAIVGCNIMLPTMYVNEVDCVSYHGRYIIMCDMYRILDT